MKTLIPLSLVPLFLCAGIDPNRLDYLEASLNDLQAQVHDLKAQLREHTVNPPAGPKTNGGCDIFVTGDFLYWKANEEGLTYALRAPVAVFNGLATGNGTFHNPHFDWDPGFRVGLGWNTGHDDWDLYFSWTRLHTAAHSSTHATAEKLIWATLADTQFTNAPADHASSHLRLHLNVLDLELGRSFYIGKSLSLRPHFGLENIWISQHFRAKYSGHFFPQASVDLPADFNTLHFRNNFWGIGARAGLNTQWELGWGFSLVGDVAWALLYGEFDLKRASNLNNNYLFVGTNKAHIDEDLTQIKAAMEFCLGIRWDQMFAHDRFHFGLKLGWEEHIYFSQNQLFNPMTTPGKGTFANNDLSLQGLTVSGRFDF